MTTPMLAQFKRKLISSAILITKKRKPEKASTGLYAFCFVWWNEFEGSISNQLLQGNHFFKMIRANSIFNTIIFNFITTFKHVYINQCIKDLYSLVFENTVSQFYRYMSTNKHKKVSMWYLEII